MRPLDGRAARWSRLILACAVACAAGCEGDDDGEAASGPHVYDLDTDQHPDLDDRYRAIVDGFAVTELLLAPYHDRPAYLNHPIELTVRVEVEAEPFQTELWVGLHDGAGDFCVVDRIEAHHVQEAFDLAINANRSLARHDAEREAALATSFAACEAGGACERENETCLPFVLPTAPDELAYRCSTPTAAGYMEALQVAPPPTLTPADLTGQVATEIILGDQVVIPADCAHLVGKQGLQVWLTFDPAGETRSADEEGDAPEAAPAEGDLPGPGDGFDDGDLTPVDPEAERAAEAARVFGLRMELEADFGYALAPDPGVDAELTDARPASAVVVLDPDADRPDDLSAEVDFRVDGALDGGTMARPGVTFDFTLQPVGPMKPGCAQLDPPPVDGPAAPLLAMAQVRMGDAADAEIHTTFVSEPAVELDGLGIPHARVFGLKLDDATRDSVINGEWACWDSFEVVACLHPDFTETAEVGEGDDCQRFGVLFERVTPSRHREDVSDQFDDLQAEAMDQSADEAASFGGCSEQLVREYSDLRKKQREAEEAGRFSRYFVQDPMEQLKQRLRARAMYGNGIQNFNGGRVGRCDQRISWTGWSIGVQRRVADWAVGCMQRWLDAGRPGGDPWNAFGTSECHDWPQFLKDDVPELRGGGCNGGAWHDTQFGLRRVIDEVAEVMRDPAGRTEHNWNYYYACNGGALPTALCSERRTNLEWAVFQSHLDGDHFSNWGTLLGGSGAGRLSHLINTPHGGGGGHICRQAVITSAMRFSVDGRGRLTYDTNPWNRAAALRELVIPKLCEAQDYERQANAKLQQILNQCHYVSKPFDDRYAAAGRFVPQLYHTLSQSTAGLRATFEGGFLNDYFVHKPSGKFRLTAGPQIRVYLDGEANNEMTKDFALHDILRAYAVGAFYSDVVNSYFGAAFHVLTHDLWKIEFRLQDDYELPAPPPLTKEKEKCKYFFKPPVPARLMVCASLGGELGLTLNLKVDGISTSTDGGQKRPGLRGVAKPYVKIFAAATAGIDFFVGKAGLKLNIDPIVEVSFPITAGLHWTIRWDSGRNSLTWELVPSIKIENVIDLFGGNVVAFVESRVGFNGEVELYKWDPYEVFQRTLYYVSWTINGSKGL
ncbi:MAG: hypothetical protein H6704_12160 [Myxococcales bacterium]|nr:hypothetical protein [Myxococcales bacterium]